MIGSILGTIGSTLIGNVVGGLFGDSGPSPTGRAVGSAVGSAVTGPSAADMERVVRAADPFSAERPQYQQQLRQMMTSGGFSPADPSYQFRFEQGQEAVRRGAVAGGYGGSGNLLAELTKYGQGLASTEYGNQFNRLARLSGVDTGAPGSAASLLSGQYTGAAQGGAELGGALGSALGQGIGGWFNTGMEPVNLTAADLGLLTPSDYGPGGAYWGPTGTPTTTFDFNAPAGGSTYNPYAALANLAF